MNKSQHPACLCDTGALEAPLLDVAACRARSWNNADNTIVVFHLLPDAADDTTAAHCREATAAQDGIQQHLWLL